jgi:hypothetical protein
MNLMEASTQWMNRPADQRFETLTALRDAVHGRRLRSKSEDLRIEDLRVEAPEAGGLVLNHKIQPSAPTHYAFGQLATVAGAPAGYLRTLPAPLAAQCINTSLERRRTVDNKEAFKVMTIRNDEGDINTLQAVTSTTYGRIWDADCVDAVGRIVEQSNGRFFNPLDWSRKPSGLYASDHDVFMFMIDGGSMVDGGSERDQMNRGFIVWNSEVGARTFGLMTFLFRVCCGNHIVYDAKDVTKLVVRHTSGGPARFDRDAMPALLDYVNASAKPVEDAVKRLKGIRLDWVSKKGDDFENGIGQFAKANGFTRGEVREAIQFARSEEGQCDSVWDMVNGFTASARALEYMDARIDLEKRAGKLMSLAS